MADSKNPEYATNPEEDKWAKKYAESKDTQGRTKLYNYFVEITKTEPFIKKIKDLRKRYDIPEDGFNTKEMIFPPEEWEHRFSGTQKKLKSEIYGMCKEYGLHFLSWSSEIESILFYNDGPHLVTDEGFDVCMFSDLRNEVEEPFGKKIQDDDNLLFPLAVRISLFASQRDIIDFVRKNFFLIKGQQEYYLKEMKDFRIGRVKTKKEKVQKRNDFIYQNRHLPRRNIMELLTDKYGADNTLDVGYIGKIISLERKRRKEL